MLRLQREVLRGDHPQEQELHDKLEVRENQHLPVDTMSFFYPRSGNPEGAPGTRPSQKTFHSRGAEAPLDPPVPGQRRNGVHRRVREHQSECFIKYEKLLTRVPF